MTVATGKRIWWAMKGAILRKLPLMITCRQFEEFLLDYLDGNLTAGQRRIFEFHMTICRECRDYLAAYRETVKLGKQVFDDPDAPLPEEVPEDLVNAILAAQRSTSGRFPS